MLRGQCSNGLRVSALVVQQSNNRRVNVEEAGRLNRRRNPRRVQCLESNEHRSPRSPSALRRKRSVLRNQCSNSNGRRSSGHSNSDRKLNVLHDRYSNSRRANASVVQPNGRNRTPNRNSNRSRVVHLLSAVAVTKASRRNLASRINLNSFLIER